MVPKTVFSELSPEKNFSCDILMIDDSDFLYKYKY